MSTLFRKLGLKQRTAAAAYVARIHNSRLQVEQGQTWPPPASSSFRKPGPASGQSKACDEDKCTILSQSLMLLLWAGHSGSGSSCHPWLVRSQARSAVGWFGLCLRS